MVRSLLKGSWWVVLLLFAGAMAQTQKPQELRVGVFTFMSGFGAAYGMPAKNAADLVIEQINRAGGIAGVPIRPFFVDEAVGVDGVVAEFRRLATTQNIDVVIGTLSSGHILAVAPVAEELKVPTLVWEANTHQLFLRNRYRYVFRTGGGSTIPQMFAYAAYTLQRKPEVRRIAIINPDYAFGRDAALIYKETLLRFRPALQIVAELYPRLGQSNYATEISRILIARPDVVFSNLWGSDLENFVRQAQQRNLFQQSLVVLALGGSVLQKFGSAFPDGVVVGVLGDGWHLTPDAQANPETKRFVELYRQRYGEDPVFPSFKIANTILVMKAAYEKALKRTRGRWPTKEELVAALEGIEVETFTGTLRIRPEDHEGLVDQVVGVSKRVPGYPYPIMAEMVRYPAEQVTPPPFVEPVEWIRSLPSDYLKRLPQPGSYRP